MSKNKTQTYAPDPAAIFGAAYSLYNACIEAEELKWGDEDTLSDAYSGMDGCLRAVMKTATHFETWACTHVNFDELNDVWPYMLQDNFGEHCLVVRTMYGLEDTTDQDCEQIALRLKLPLRYEL